jgi:broad specificity phosphatase PhoE
MGPQIILYVIRHGQTTLNKQNSFRGPLNIDLDKTGWRQANKLKEYFSGVEFSHAFSSPKNRSIDTANKILEGRDTKLVVNENLQALNVGDLAGKEKTPETDAIVEFHFQNPDIPMPGGESFNDFKARVNPLLKDAIEIGLQEQNPVLLCVHSSIIHELGYLIGGHHTYCLVEPGGVAAVYIQDGELDAEPVYRAKEEITDRSTAIT